MGELRGSSILKNQLPLPPRKAAIFSSGSFRIHARGRSADMQAALGEGNTDLQTRRLRGTGRLKHLHSLAQL